MVRQKISPRLYSWASIIDDQALAQAHLTAQLPFIDPHLVLMPDAHVGMGATVGSVIPTAGAVIPAAVGVDIGCGMVAVRTQFTAEQLLSQRRPLARLREQIERVIPLGGGHDNRRVADSAIPAVDQLTDLATEQGVAPGEFTKAWPRQVGSLGGGNHFIEVTADEEGMVWGFLHSGSRGVGNKIARRFIAAQRLEEVNCHHNYTATEEHFGREVLVSRKGAIAAHDGVRGLIPGSMGTASYVVRGQGNQMSLCSAPHGAGRVYSRTRARKTFNQQDLRERMRGIEYRDSAAFVDEIPDAYKDIDVVMADAADLVTVEHELHQIINVKGQ